MGTKAREPKAARDWHVYQRGTLWRLVDLPQPGHAMGEVVGTADTKGVMLCQHEVAPRAVLGLLLRSAPDDVLDELIRVVHLATRTGAPLEKARETVRRALETGDKR